MPLGTEVDGDTAPPPLKLKGHTAPTCWPVYIVAKRSPISVTTELLYITVMSAIASGSEEPGAHDEPQGAACSVTLMKPVLVGCFYCNCTCVCSFH